MQHLSQFQVLLELRSRCIDRSGCNTAHANVGNDISRAEYVGQVRLGVVTVATDWLSNFDTNKAHCILISHILLYWNHIRARVLRVSILESLRSTVCMSAN